jgi:hypothetical protein
MDLSQFFWGCMLRPSFGTNFSLVSGVPPPPGGIDFVPVPLQVRLLLGHIRPFPLRLGHFAHGINFNKYGNQLISTHYFLP